MPQMKSYRRALPCLAAMLLSAFAHGADTLAKTRIFVPDQGNNRVLIYDHPTKSGQRADAVLGQGSFSTATSGTSDSTMSGPSAFVVDKAGNLYVSDSGNCRVLQFVPPFTTGKAASLVLGEPDADTSCGASPSDSVLGRTGGLALDKVGNLWVGDPGSNRVVRFTAPFTTGQPADIVIGQPDFFSTDCGVTSAVSLCRPQGVAIDDSGMLWVADSTNNRVLGYKPPFISGANAIVELGQPAATAFSSNQGGLSASSLSGPTGIGVDPAKRLWVADTANNRLLRFNPKFHNGDAAVIVLGQPDFDHNFANQNLGSATASTLNGPQGFFIRNSGDLWVGDSGNNRTLRYSASTFHNGQNAALALGQPDLTHNQKNQGNLDPNDKTQNAPFTAGPSLIALAVLGTLAGGRQLLLRIQRRA